LDTPTRKGVVQSTKPPNTPPPTTTMSRIRIGRDKGGGAVKS